MTLNELEIGIITVKRDDADYCWDTLQDLYRVCEGHEATIHIHRGDGSGLMYEGPSIPWYIHLTTDGITEGVNSELPLHLRHRLNYMKAMMRSSIIMEDDLQFHDEWVTRGLTFIRALRNMYPDGMWIFDFLCRDGSIGGDGMTLKINASHHFYGTQCIYYNEKVRAIILKHMMEKESGRATDLLIRDVMVEHGIRWVTPAESLVEHVGFKSTGLSSLESMPRAYNWKGNGKK